LENGSIANPASFFEYVLVRVGELIFSADFYIIDMREGFFRDS